jgi:transcriptional regulator with XRE-family HTH domain
MRRLKQAEVAERMGITQQAYSRLERAGANPTLGLLVRLEEALQQELLLLA